MQQIQANDDAFAAMIDDGSVVTWAGAGSDGESSAMQDQLKNVLQGWLSKSFCVASSMQVACFHALQETL